MSQRPRIVFATLAAGGSHVSSARAMQQALQRHHPDRFETSIRELMVDYGFEDWVAEHKRQWRWQLEHPRTIVWGQRFINAFPRGTQWWWRRILRDFARVAAKRLAEEAPTLVVGNHPFMVTALTMSQREFGLEVPVVHFQTTTLDTSSLWAVPEASRYFCGSPIVRRELAQMGVDPARIDVVGYPVREDFLREIDKSQARAELGLRDAFTALVMLGGEGVGGSPERFVRALRELDFEVQVVVITGRNPALESELKQAWSDDPLVRVEGFVDNVGDFQLACDVFVGKTGPASTLETLAVGRPVLAPARAGSGESRIVDFVEGHGLGHYVPSLDQLTARVRAYHADPAALEEVGRRARAYDFPGMARRVADYVAHYAETGEPDESMRGPGIE